MRGNSHVRCGVGEKPAITSKVYLSLFIPQYIKGKNYPESIHYDCPKLEPILESTYGCIVYQGATCS